MSSRTGHCVSPDRWKIGRVSVTRVVEIEGPFPGAFILPAALPDRIQEIGWLRPHLATTSGNLLTSIHAFVVESEGQRILVDTCVGNDQQRPALPNWHRAHARIRLIRDAAHQCHDHVAGDPASEA